MCVLVCVGERRRLFCLQALVLIMCVFEVGGIMGRPLYADVTHMLVYIFHCSSVVVDIVCVCVGFSYCTHA